MPTQLLFIIVQYDALQWKALCKSIRLIIQQWQSCLSDLWRRAQMSGKTNNNVLLYCAFNIWCYNWSRGRQRSTSRTKYKSKTTKGGISIIWVFLLNAGSHTFLSSRHSINSQRHSTAASVTWNRLHYCGKKKKAVCVRHTVESKKHKQVSTKRKVWNISKK